MHKWQLTNVMATNPAISAPAAPPLSLCLPLSLPLACSLCRLVALYKRQSGQRAGNCFHICDNHQHLHRSAATPAEPQPQQPRQQHEAPLAPRLPLSASAAQDAAACTAAAAVSVHLVVHPATFSCSMPHATCNKNPNYARLSC